MKTKTVRVDELKCWFGGSDHPSEYDYVAACFARNYREAKKLLWSSCEVHEDCDGEYVRMQMERRKEFDNLATEVGLINDAAILRQMGWRMDGDEFCDCCGLATMDGKFSLCDECGHCEECDHADDCPAVEVPAELAELVEVSDE